MYLQPTGLNMPTGKRSTLFYIDGSQAISVTQLQRTKVINAKSIVIRKGTRIIGSRLRRLIKIYENKITYIE